MRISVGEWRPKHSPTRFFLGQDAASEKMNRKEASMKKLLVLLVIPTIVILVLVWMNRYRYENIETLARSKKIARVNRFTGQICYSQDDGSWSQYIWGRPKGPSVFVDNLSPELREKYFKEPDACK